MRGAEAMTEPKEPSDVRNFIGTDQLQREPPASPMSPRDALIAAVRAVHDYVIDALRANLRCDPYAFWWKDEHLLAAVPEEARLVLLEGHPGRCPYCQVCANFGRLEGRVEAYADAARIARERTRAGCGCGDWIANVIGARAREVAEGGGEE
jgi:hypothetical protein